MDFFGKHKNDAMEAYEENEQREENKEINAEPEKVVEVKKKKPFAIWEVDGKEYKMKLRTQDIKYLESKYKTNLMNIMGTGEGGMPALTVMMDVAFAAMQPWHHRIKKNDMDALFDAYLDAGGSQLQFYTSVYMNIFAVSGFFSTSLTEQMQDTLEEAAETL